jgi:hypothetical protein
MAQTASSRANIEALPRERDETAQALHQSRKAIARSHEVLGRSQVVRREWGNNQE